MRTETTMIRTRRTTQAMALKTRRNFMKSLLRCTVVAVLGLVAAAPALADLEVATSLTDLACVAQFVGGSKVGRRRGDLQESRRAHVCTPITDPSRMPSSA